MLTVVAFHAGVPFLGGGYVGVDVFFVISGFLITQLLLRDVARGRSTRTNLAEFYARRARRILPAAMLVIAATVAAAAVLYNGLDAFRTARDGIGAAVFGANFQLVDRLGYFADSKPSLFTHYWSLSVEEQFYALWPLLLFGITAVVPPRLRNKSLAAFVTVVSLASFALAIAWTFDGGWLSHNPSRAFYLLPTRAWELGLGALIAIAVPRLAKLDGRARSVLAPAGLAAIAISVVTLPHVPFPGWAALLPTAGTAALLIAGIGAPVPGAVGRVLSTPLAQRLGLYSFSLYLWHFPIIEILKHEVYRSQSSWALRLVVVLVVGIPASIVTYHVVENPMRYAKFLRGHALRTVGIAVAAIVVLVLAVGGVEDHAKSTLSAHKAAAAPTGAIVPTPYVPSNLVPSLTGALNKGWLDHPCDDVCQPLTAPGTRVALIGDSHAEHLADSLAASLKPLNATLTPFLRRACGWFGLPKHAGKLERDCAAFNRNALADITANPPALIVLSGHASWVTPDLIPEWTQDIQTTLAAMPKQSKVVVLSQTPFGPDVPDCLADHLSNATACNRVWPTQLNDILKEQTAAAGATFVDLEPKLCGGAICPVIIGNQLVYTDANHFTLQFSMTLAPFLTEQLRGLLPAVTP